MQGGRGFLQDIGVSLQALSQYFWNPPACILILESSGRFWKKARGGPFDLKGKYRNELRSRSEIAAERRCPDSRHLRPESGHICPNGSSFAFCSLLRRRRDSAYNRLVKKITVRRKQTRPALCRCSECVERWKELALLIKQSRRAA